MTITSSLLPFIQGQGTMNLHSLCLGPESWLTLACSLVSVSFFSLLLAVKMSMMDERKSFF